MNTANERKANYESSLVRRISRNYMIAMICVNAIILISFCYVNLSYLYTDEMVDMASRVAHQFEDTLMNDPLMEEYFYDSRTDYYQRLLDDLNKYSRPEKIHLYVVFPNGVTSRYNEDVERVTFELLPPEFFAIFRKTIQGNDLTTEWPGPSNHFNRWTVAIPIHGASAEPGGVIIASIVIWEVMRRLVSVFTVIGAALVLSFLFMLQMQRGFANILASPLDNITQALKNWSLSGFQSGAAASRTDEIGNLARALDEVALDLEREQKCRDEDEKNRREFFHNVSHELKTPVAALRAQIELLKDGMATEEELPECYESLFQSVVYLQDMVEDLLTLSRLQTPGYEMEKEPCCLADILNGVYQAMSPSAAEKGICLLAEQEPEPEQTLVLGNYTRLRQLIVIFVENAIKYSDAGSTITISLSRTGDRLRLLIRDEGIGIPESEIAAVFQRQYRASHAGNRYGTGLGLTIAREISDLFGFELSLSSREHEGTTVEILMPALPESA
ncbi:MAG: ATP-binding protein [Clostridiales bacterium]|nr:ATP-binding protein [Clostridiales bacterium]